MVLFGMQVLHHVRGARPPATAVELPKLKRKIDRLHERAVKLAAKVELEKLRSEAKAQKEQLTGEDRSSPVT
jgi:hypothetical protein